MTPLERDIDAWNKKEQRFAKLFGQEALNDKGFLKIKHAELSRLYRGHRRQATGVEDRAMLSMLRAGNRNMEKKLYPNRLLRIGRRLGKFLGRSFRNIRNGIIKRSQQQRLRLQEWNNPGVIFSDNGKISVTPVKAPVTKQQKNAHELQDPLQLLPRNQNRQRIPEEAQKKGMNL